MKYAALSLILFLFFFQQVEATNNLLSPRGAAMGNTAVSLSDSWSIRNNQAGLAWIKQPAVGIVYENKFMMNELSTKSVGLVLPFKKVVAGASITSFGFNLFKENEIKLGFAKAFGKNISFGVGINYFETVMAEYGSKKSFVAEAGLQAKPFTNFTIAAHAYNLTRAKLAEYNHEKIPSIIRLGANYFFSEKVIIAIEAEKNITTNPVLKIGIEYHPVQALYFRAGISTKPAVNSFGFGLSIKQMKIDISASYHYPLGLSTQAGVIYEFNKKRKTND